MTRKDSLPPKCDMIAGTEVNSSVIQGNDDARPCHPKPAEFVALTVLNLSNSKIVDFPECVLSHLPSLVDLDLSNNKLEHVPDSLGEAKRLIKLNLSSNLLAVFPSCIQNGLFVLQELDISNNYLSSFPKPACALVLRKLNCALNMFNSFPPWLFSLDYYNLEDLDLSENNLFKDRLPPLAYFPRGFRRIVKRLALRNVGLTESFLFVVACFSGLEELDISRGEESANNPCGGTINQIKSLDALAQLAPGLNTLKARHLGAKPPEFARLSHVKHLDLSQNWFMGFDVHPKGPLFLVELHLSSCDIVTLPANFGVFKMLKVLDLSRNLITELPSSFFSLTNLEYLDLYYNYIGNEPCFKCFSNLKALDVCANDFAVPMYPLGENGPSYEELKGNLRREFKTGRMNSRRVVPLKTYSSDDDRSDESSCYDDELELEPAPPEAKDSDCNSKGSDEVKDESWNKNPEVEDDFDPTEFHFFGIRDSDRFENPNAIRDRCPLKVRQSENFHVPWNSIYVPTTLLPGPSSHFHSRTYAEGQFDDI